MLSARQAVLKQCVHCSSKHTTLHSLQALSIIDQRTMLNSFEVSMRMI